MLTTMTISSPTPPGRKRVGKLHTIEAVRREAARLYREARRGEVAAGDASKLAVLLQLVARLIEGSDLEARVRRLEGEVDG